MNNIKRIIESTIKEYLNENFKPMQIDSDISDFILDWKQIKINGESFNFMRLNGSDKNKFVLSIIWEK